MEKKKEFVNILGLEDEDAYIIGNRERWRED